jgi:hypothetical protein
MDWDTPVQALQRIPGSNGFDPLVNDRTLICSVIESVAYSNPL